MIIERTILGRVPEGKDLDPLDYDNLLLDGISCPDIFPSDKEFLEKFIECTHMSFNSCGLKNLKNLPVMPKLKKLDLQDNKLQTGLEYIADRCKQLEVLKLSGNLISNVNEI